jgi:ABC-2 type transport system ATP-binding protein
MLQHRSLVVAALIALALATLSPVVAVAQTDAPTAGPTSERVVISTSDFPDLDLPDDHTPIDMVVQVHRPAISRSEPVPVLLEGHGWGGSRRTAVGSFGPYLAAGYAVVSIDQRGFGESGGRVTVMDPDQEGQDLIALMEWLSAQDWVQKEAPEPGSPFAVDPVVGAIGGSYGGGYQYLLALTEMREFDGFTRVDALAPEITWHDLNTSLAPQDVPRTAWLSLLYAIGATRVERYVSEGFAYGTATGTYPNGTVPGVHDLKAEFFRHGPSYHLDEGRLLDIPVLMRQGFSDNLFNFNEAWDNFTLSLTDEARAQSTLIGFNGGHALPNVYPIGTATGSDACSGQGGFAARTIEFFDIVLKGEAGDPRVVGDGEALQFTTVAGDCIRLDEDDITPTTVELLTSDPSGTLGGVTATPTMVGAPIHIPIPGTSGTTVAGVPTVTADVVSVGVDQRAFFALSVGSSPADARVIQNNVMPLRMFGPTTTGRTTTFRLQGLAIEVPQNQSLFLTVAAVSDMFGGHGSRTPGAIGLLDVEIELPVVDVVRD